MVIISMLCDIVLFLHIINIITAFLSFYLCFKMKHVKYAGGSYIFIAGSNINFTVC